MPEHRGTTTNRLADIIQMVLIARQTGLLQVERGGGDTLEEGTIIFANGQIIDAMGGTRTGDEALNWLKKWGSCRFVFIHKKLEEVVPPSQPPPQDTGKKPETLLKRFMPFYNREASSAFNQPPPLQEDAHSVAKPLEVPLPPPPAAPYRLRQGSEIVSMLEKMGFSRMHRHVFQLIDGQRTAKELAWLTQHSLDEIHMVLADLERIGLIRQP